MSVFEVLASSGLAAWMAASAWYAFRLPGTRQVLRRLNAFHSWANWSMFGADLESSPTTLEIEYRDSAAAVAPPQWLAAFPGQPGRWRAFFWLPERRIRRRLQDLAIDIKRASEQTPPVHRAVDANFAIVEEYLADLKPLAPALRREIRLVERSVGTGAPASPGPTTWADKVILTHLVSRHD